MEYQRTIKSSFSYEGRGLHTGRKVKVTFKPAPANTGVIFCRVDLPEKPLIKAEIDYLLKEDKRPRRTSIGQDGIEVHTIEHILSALFGLGIDDILIEINNSEFPGADGSALPLVKLLKKNGYRELKESKNCFQIREPIYLEEEKSSIIGLPYPELKISYTLNYPSSFLKSQFLSINLNNGIYEKEIAPARTFCLEEEVEPLLKSGLGKGSDYQNTLVVGQNGIIDNQPRFEDEPVRHKILDLIGDLSLLNMGIKGHIIALCSGHNINVMLVKKIKDSYRRERTSGVEAPTFTEIDKPVLETEDILKVIPHRYPFLFIDRVLALEEDKYAIGVKNLSIDEDFFRGHFPEHPVMPGVLVIEAMAQLAGVLMLKKKENRGKLAYFMGINNAKFRRAVMPGDQLRLEVEVIKLRSRIGQVHTKALVDGKVAAEADLMFAIVTP